jgi:hypothetical protein
VADPAPRSAEPAGRSAHTELATSRGRIGVRDGLLDDGIAGVTLVRLVRVLDAELDVQHELSLAGFGSDAGPDRWRLEPGGATVALGNRWISVRGVIATPTAAPRCAPGSQRRPGDGSR